MKRRLLIAVLIAVSAAVVARQAAAMWFLTDQSVTPENAKANHISVETTNSKQNGEAVILFRVARTIDRKHDGGMRPAQLIVRKDGKLVSSSSLEASAEKDGEYWMFEVASDYVAESVLELSVIDRTRSEPLTGVGTRYKIKLSDFPVGWKPHPE
jgi:hypothetical protein